MTASHSASDMLVSIRSRRMPALLISTSSLPKWSMAWLMRRSAPSQLEMSSVLATASPPIAVISSTTCWAGPASFPVPSIEPPRSFTTTLAPWWASMSECSRPIPRPAPVTIATRPSQMPLMAVRPFSSPRRVSVEGAVTIGTRHPFRHVRQRIVIGPDYVGSGVACQGCPSYGSTATADLGGRHRTRRSDPPGGRRVGHRHRDVRWRGRPQRRAGRHGRRRPGLERPARARPVHGRGHALAPGADRHARADLRDHGRRDRAVDRSEAHRTDRARRGPGRSPPDPPADLGRQLPRTT